MYFSQSAKSIKSEKRHVVNLIMYLPPVTEAYAFARELDRMLTVPVNDAESRIVRAFVRKPMSLPLLAQFRDEQGPSLNLCPYAASCARVCLQTSGMLGITPAGARLNMPHAAMLYRYLVWRFDYARFEREVKREIRLALRKAVRLSRKSRRKWEVAVRPNGTSDSWELLSLVSRLVEEVSPSVRVYDYTKDPRRALAYLDGVLPENVARITYSWSETSPVDLMKAGIDVSYTDRDWARLNVAAVVRGGMYPGMSRDFLEKHVLDGDKHDARYLDQVGSVAVLTPKGKARKLDVPFVIGDV